jgi:hypothetical protein
MRITGHKTEAIYRRYAIVNEQDLRDAARRVEVHRATLPAAVAATPIRVPAPLSSTSRPPGLGANRLRTG